jgi:hypothetical protein
VSTRTIVTSQPDVACDVCERRLLRGEQPDVFLSAGQRLTVCELCAPRAALEGWQRESQSQSLALPPMRPRRGRSFLQRLRQVASRPALGAEPATGEAERSQPFDFFDAAGAEPAPGSYDADGLAFADLLEGGAQPTGADPALARALQSFNDSEYPRRVAGVARSLGAPVVSVRVGEDRDSVITIVVAWELCWYRYEIDLSGDGQALAVAQGTELSELTAEEQIANAGADDFGALALVA